MELRALLKPKHCQYGVVAGVFLFITLRVIFGMYIGQQFDRAEVGFASVGKNMMLFPLAWLLVFKGATIVMAIGLLCLWNFRSNLSVVLILIALLPGIAASLLVWDLCRSLCFTFPVLLFCTKALLRASSLQTIRRAALCGALISACLPTYYLWEDSIRYLLTLFSRRVAS
jgi:hypothetical protein